MKTKMVFKKTVFFFLLLWPVFVLAQEQKKEEAQKKKQSFFNVEGMLGLAAGKNNLVLTAGGPFFKMRFGQKWAIGAGAFPSLYYDYANEQLEPRLGLSPRLEYKKLVFICPAFYFTTTHTWKWTFGLAWRFH